VTKNLDVCPAECLTDIDAHSKGLAFGLILMPPRNEVKGWKLVRVVSIVKFSEGLRLYGKLTGKGALQK
jgi:hypothetical protein